MPETITDCIGDLRIETAYVPVDRAIIFVVTPGFEAMLKDVIEGIYAFGDSRDAAIILFCVNEAYDNTQSWENVLRLKVESPRKADINIRTALYAAHRAVRGPKTFLALDVDMLVVGSLRPLWDLIASQPAGTLAGVRPMAEIIHPWDYVLSSYTLPVEDREQDIVMVAGDRRKELYHFNGALLIGQRLAWEYLERGMDEATPEVKQWMITGNPPWAEEAVMNLSANKYCTVVNLDRRWNQMFYTPTAETRDMWMKAEYTDAGVRYHGENGPSRILHFPHTGRPMRDFILNEIQTHGLDTQGAL